MTSRKSELVRFGPETWAKGSRGAQHPSLGRARMVNMRVYRSGLLGMRPGWGSLGVSDNGTQVPLGLGKQIDDRLLASGILTIRTSGEILYREFASGTATTTTGTVLSGVVGGGVWHHDYVNPYTIVIGAWYQITAEQVYAGVTPTFKRLQVNQITVGFVTTFGLGVTDTIPSRAVIHQGRAFVFGPPPAGEADANGWTNPQRIYYSDAYAYDTYSSASQFFDVDGAVIGAISLGSSLFFYTEEGNWYVLQGRGDPALATLNTLARNERVPFSPSDVTVVDNTAFFIPRDRTTLCVLASNGQLDTTELVAYGPEMEPRNTVFLDDEDRNGRPAGSGELNSITLPFTLEGETDTFARQFQNGVWMEDEWSVAGGPDMLVVPQSRIEVFLGSTWHARPLTIERPSNSDDEVGTSGEVIGRVELPRIDAQHQQRLRVSHVEVQGQYWRGSGYSQPAIGITVRTPSGDTSLTPDFTPTTDGEGQSFRHTVTAPSMKLEEWAEVILLDLEGVAIEHVSVALEIEDRKKL